jgi:hypothetical protein
LRWAQEEPTSQVKIEEAVYSSEKKWQV